MFKGIFLKHAPVHSQPSAMQSQLPLMNDVNANDTPVFQLGLAGFNPAERVHIAGMVKLLPQTTLKWRVGDFATADALFVCGKNTRNGTAPSSADENTLQILAGSASDNSVVLSLSNMGRPLAFSLPVVDPQIEPALGFDAASPASVQIVLENFEKCLRAKLAQFVMGKQLTQRGPQLQATTYHLLHLGQLVAVVDLAHFQIGLLADVDTQIVEAAIWEKRPTLAAAIPQHFLHTDVAKVRWIYAQYSQRDLLPGRYRHKQIHYRQPPQVVLAWLTDPQLRLLHELGARPATATQLVERLGMRPEQLAKDLTCLYFAASITTTASKATTANIGKLPKRAPEYSSSYAVGSGSAPTTARIFDSSLQQQANPADEQNITVAAKLLP